jgi:hypothetical protein
VQDPESFALCSIRAGARRAFLLRTNPDEPRGGVLLR